MLSVWLDRFGSRNPQLWRELRGTLTPRNLILAVVASLLVQGIIALYWGWKALELSALSMANRCARGSQFWQYYVGSGSNQDPPDCQASLSTLTAYFAIDWSLFAFDVFRVLTWTGAVVLVLGGSFALIANYAQEQKSGTLNFLRLAPQSSQTILMGKMLGAPAIVYSALLLALPIHTWLGFQASLSPLDLLFLYGLIAASYGLACAIGLFYAAAGGEVSLIGTILVVATMAPLAPLLNLFLNTLGTDGELLSSLLGENRLSWFSLSLVASRPFPLLYGFSIASIALLTWGIWQILNRRFQNPQTTWLSKTQTYGTVVVLNLWVLGFGWEHQWQKDPWNVLEALVYPPVFLGGILPVGFFLLAALTLPNRQMSIDWARYRHCLRTMNAETLERDRLPAPPRRQSLRAELLWGEKSPNLLEIAVSMAISMVVWLPWFFVQLNNSAQLPFFLSGLTLAGSVAIGTAIIQVANLAPGRRSPLWAVLALLAFLVLPPLILVMLSGPHIGSTTNPVLWLAFFPWGAVPVLANTLSLQTILQSLGVQAALLGCLAWYSTRQYAYFGRSEMQNLQLHERRTSQSPTAFTQKG